MRRLFHGVVTLAVLAGPPAVAQGHPDRAAPPAASVKLDFAAAIPNIAGKSLKTVLVNYAPGGSSPAHSHAKSAFILAYVLEGSVMSAVDGAPPRAFKAGEWWTENPGDHRRGQPGECRRDPVRHQRSRNRSPVAVDDGLRPSPWGKGQERRFR